MPLRLPAVAIIALLVLAAGAATGQTLVLDEDFSGSLASWGLPGAGGELNIQRGMTLVPVFGVSDATVEYRTKVQGEGLIELLLRYDPNTDDYYVFRVDTREAGGNPPGFLKRNHGEQPWVLVGERSGVAPAGDTWVTVKVQIEGATFRGYVQDELVATYEDDTYAKGGFAFRQQLSTGWVDDLRITVPEGSEYELLQPPVSPRGRQTAAYTEGTWTAHWIWSPGTDEELVRWFRKTFEVPGAIREAKLAVTCDNTYELYLNGQRVAGDGDWYSLEVRDVASLLRAGRNVLAARCTNTAPGSAGLLVELGAIARDGRFVHVPTDATWKVSKAAPEGWLGPAFDDSTWSAATSVGKHPCGPWSNQSDLRLPFLGPKQPVELVDASVPATISVAGPLKLTVAFRPTEALRADYPLVLTGRRGDNLPVDLAIMQPSKPCSTWAPGQVHRQTIEMALLPDDAYLLEPGPVELGLELRGTFYPNRDDYGIGRTLLQTPDPRTGDIHPRHAAPARAGQFTDPLGKVHQWRLDGQGRVVVEGTPYIPLDAEGVYWCDATSAGQALSPTAWQSIVRDVCQRGGPAGADFVRVRLVDHIDATQTDHEFGEDAGLAGNSRIMRISDRRFRVTSARDRLSYFAYTALCEHPRNPHLMMFQSVNDIERYTTVRIQPPWDNVGGGVYTGRELPCDGEPFEHRFIFYPREKRIRFTVSRHPAEEPITPDSGAAVSHVWLFELVDSLASRPVAAQPPAQRQRLLGMYLTSPRYLYTLYGYRGSSPQERRASLRSFIDYLKFCGINLLEFNAVDGGDTTGTAFYKSDIWPRATGDLLGELIPLCEESGIKLLPIITSLSVPEGKFGFTRDSMQMDRHGELTTFFSTRPPLPDPLRPEVQALLIRNIREILDQCGTSPAVIGVGFRVNGKIGLCYGGSTLGKSDRYTGYSKWDVAQFERDTGIDVPSMDPTPYEWLHANCWQQWLDWRCERTRQFWLECRDVVSDVRDDLTLYISCDMPSETPAWNIYWPQGETPLDCWRYHGVDPRMFAQEPGILLQRGMMIAADRYFTRRGQYARNVEAMKRFHYAPGVAELYEGAEGNACELYHNYWEEFGVFKIGEFRTEFWGAATMYPLRRGYFEPIAFSLATTNCHTLNLFSWERGSFGHEHDLRMFSRAFRALPVGEGQDATALIQGDAHGLWVRRFSSRIAVLNNTGRPRTVKLRYAPELPAGSDLVEFGASEIIVAQAATARTNLPVELPLKAYELRVLGSTPSPTGSADHGTD